MNKLILGIIYFVLLMVLSASLFAQRDYESVSQDSGKAITDAFSVDDGWYFGGLKTPDLATDNDTIFFLVSIDGTTANYDTLKNYDDEIVYVKMDTVSHYVTLDFKQVYIWEWWKIVTENNVAEDKTWFPYKIEMK